MTTDQLKDKVSTQIARGKLKRAFNVVEDFLESNDLDIEYTHQLSRLKGRHRNAEKQLLSDLIDAREHSGELNKITRELQILVDEIAEEEGNSMGENDHNIIQTPEDSQTNTGENHILFLASNPLDLGQLRLGKEAREIDESLRRSNHRDKFKLNQKFAVRTEDLRRALLDFNPAIVHFSGHGIKKKGNDEADVGGIMFNEAMDVTDRFGIALENQQGKTHWVAAEALAGMFALFKADLQCVVLNACYSRLQAEAINEHIPYVIGMKYAVPDETAIIFASSFYDALGAGRDIPFAYHFAKQAISVEGLPGDHLPVLLSKN